MEKEFLVKMQDLLDCEQSINMDTILSSLEEWDSLSFVSFLALANAKYGKKLLPKQVKEAKTIKDLYFLVK
jgi:acyl carrier protein